jgi:hypothetical protein
MSLQIPIYDVSGNGSTDNFLTIDSTLIAKINLLQNMNVDVATDLSDKATKAELLNSIALVNSTIHNNVASLSSTASYKVNANDAILLGTPTCSEITDVTNDTNQVANTNFVQSVIAPYKTLPTRVNDLSLSIVNKANTGTENTFSEIQNFNNAVNFNADIMCGNAIHQTWNHATVPISQSLNYFSSPSEFNNIVTFNTVTSVPDISQYDTSSKIANTKYVDEAISALVATAPSTLNTLNELSTALGNDPNFATTMTTTLSGKAGLNVANTFALAQTFNGISNFTNTINQSSDINVTGTSNLQNTEVQGLLNVTGTTNFHGVPIIQNDWALNANTFFRSSFRQGIEMIGYGIQQNGASTSNSLGKTAFFDTVDVLTISEKVYPMPNPIALVGTADYLQAGVFYIIPSSVSELCLDISNVPTVNTFKTYVVTVLIDSATYKTKFTSVKVNGTTRTLIFEGSNNVDISTASVIVQRFVIIHLTNNLVPWKVMSSLTTFT